MPKTILVADDSVTIRKVVELTFRESGIRVQAVANGGEALDAIAALRPDLVLADVVMPEPTGYEVCRVVKSSEQPVPVLLLAGTFEPFDADRARECGADGHVVKPFESRVLLARVEELLARPAAPAPPLDATPRLRAEVEEALQEIATLEGAFPPGPAVDAPAPSDVVEALLGPEEEAPPAVGDPADAPGGTLSEDDVERIARAVVARLSDKVLREIAWEVVPDLADAIIRERLRQIERVEADPL